MSACATGLTDVGHFSINEYHGLASAFLLAGAQTVVASLWSVNDISTALLMRRFHGNLYTGELAKAAALREAQQWLRELPVADAVSILMEQRDELGSTRRLSAVDAVGAVSVLRARGKKPFAHPSYWAAFQCIGAGWPVRE